MRVLRRSLSGLAAALLLTWLSANAAQAQYYRDQLRPRPGVREYHPRTDRFVHAESLLFPGGEKRLSDTALHGNRLTKFRYLGPRKQAGLYRVLDGYIEENGYDPRKYRYRW